MISFTVQENVTDYLNQIQDAMEENKETIVKEAGKTLAYLVYNQGKIWGRNEYGDFGLLYVGGAPFHSGALVSSAFREEQQLYSSEKNRGILGLYWTGMYADYSWWEFRHDSNISEPPEFDYAYYQETGDKTGIPHSYSKNLEARHTGFFERTVNDGNVQQRLYADMGDKYLRILLNKQLK